MSLFGASARQMRVALATAPDAALERIVKLLDGLADRGGADQLLAEVRPRLRRLRPARPIRFTRLLALPLEGALVAPAAWTRDASQIPRNAIAPLAEAVRLVIGADAAAVDQAGAGHTMAEAALVAQLGGRIWRLAGMVALPLPPPGWEAAGLPRESAAPILALCGSLWRHGTALWEARLAAEQGPPEALLRAALGPMVPDGAPALVAATTFLLQDAETPARVAAVAGGLAPKSAALMEAVLTAVLDGQAAALAGASSTGEMADCAAALGRRLVEVDSVDVPGHRESRRRHAAQLRRTSAEACQARFATALRTELLEPAALAAAGPHAEDRVVEALEKSARDLRRLAGFGRKLGQDAAFDKALLEALPRLLALGQRPVGLSRVDVARLVEILAGPDAALVLFGDQALAGG